MRTLSLVLVAAAFALYVYSPELFIYASYPLPVYALLVAAIAAAWMSPRRGLARTALVGATALVTGGFLLMTMSLSRLEPVGLAVKVGDRFPDFTLTTSTGESWSPSQIAGSKVALYILYRGDW